MHTFLLSWDMTGIEAVIDVTAIEQERSWRVLKGEVADVNLNHLVNRIIIRARYNSQRHYEVYTLNVEDGIDADDVREMFENDPQGSAELVRSRGHKLYSDRVRDSKVKIK